MDTYTPEQIEKILTSYKLKKEKEKEYYHNVTKLNPTFILKNRARAKEHYKLNKDKKTDHYNSHKELIKSKNLYNYYKKKDNIHLYKTRHSDRFELLKKEGFIK